MRIEGVPPYKEHLGISILMLRKNGRNLHPLKTWLKYLSSEMFGDLKMDTVCNLDTTLESYLI